MTTTIRSQQASTKRPAGETTPNTQSPPMVFRCTYVEQYGCDEIFKSEVEVFSHDILSHGVTPFRKTEDGQYICPLAKELGCKATLDSFSSWEIHLKSMHRGEGWPCPIAEIHGCKSKFTTAQGVSSHINSVHRKKRYPCPWAKKENCEATFSSTSSAHEHTRHVHDHSLRFPCPLADQEKCDRIFANSHAARQHANSVHRKKRYPCPSAEKENCTATFAQSSGAHSHSRLIHEKKRYPCPLAESENCNRTFASVDIAAQHADSAHKKLRYACPLANEFGCTKLFAWGQDARKHSEIHQEVRVTYSCPLAEEYECESKFTGKKQARYHARCHTHPFLCLRIGCTARFATIQEVLQHSDSPEHAVEKVFLCPLSCCRAAVSGQQLSACGMRDHRKMHIRLSHIADDTKYDPLEVEELPFQSDLPLYTRILRHGRCHFTNHVPRHSYLEDDQGENENLDLGDADCKDQSDTCAKDDEAQDELMFESFEEPELGDLGTGMLSQEHRLRILDRNTTMWKSEKHSKVSFANLNLRCIGPNPILDNLIIQRCPDNVTIDLDTSRLLRVRNGLQLSARCVACHVYLEVSSFFQSEGIELYDENIGCTYPRCDKQSFHRSGRCPQHLSPIIWKSHRENAAIDLGVARKSFESAARKRWIFPPQYNIVRDRIKAIAQGTRPGSDLVILDDEFSPSSRQLWEFAMIERVSGKILINTIVKHHNGLDHNHLGEHPFLKILSRSKARSVFSSSRRSDIDLMDTHEIASALQRVGISQDTVILAYHSSQMDLRILRELLESEGYENILPPDENCIPLVNPLRANINAGVPKNAQIPLSLEVLFPLMYPRHHLIGLNHQALVDCEQTRLVCMAFDELCRPIEERGKDWQSDMVVKPAQLSILDWLKDKQTLDNNDAKRKRRRDLDEKEGVNSKRVLRSQSTFTFKK